MKEFIECKMYYDDPIYTEHLTDDILNEEERDRAAVNDFKEAKEKAFELLLNMYDHHYSSEDFWGIKLDMLRIECKKIPRW